MPRNDGVQVSALDVVHSGIKLGIQPSRALEIWRSIGGQIQEQAFYKMWKQELALFDKWSEERRADEN